MVWINATVNDQHNIINGMEEYADQYKSKWISVKDNYSDMGKRVLCLTHTGVMYIGFSLNNEWYIDGRSKTFIEMGYEVTHWMPLPEKPQI